MRTTGIGLSIALAVLAVPLHAQVSIPPVFVERAPGHWTTFPVPVPDLDVRASGVHLRARDGSASLDLDLPADWRLEVAMPSGVRFTRMSGAGVRRLAAASALRFVDDIGHARLTLVPGLRGSLDLTWDLDEVQRAGQVRLRYDTAQAHTLALPVSPPGARWRWVATGPGCAHLERTTAKAAGGTALTQPLVWGTYFGGADTSEFIESMALDGTGRLILAGATASTDLPTTAGSFDPEGFPGLDAFVSALSEDGTELLFSTFLGGSGDEGLARLALASDGSIVVGGTTASSDFPTTPGAVDPTKNGDWEAYVARLSGTGDALLASTYLGGGGIGAEYVRDVAVDPNDGSIVVAGRTCSAAFPTTPASYAPTNLGNCDAFISRLSPDLTSLLASTYFGDLSSDTLTAMTLLPDGTPVISGSTHPLELAYTIRDSPFAGVMDNLYAARLTADLSAVLWSTPIGSRVDAIRRHSDGSLVFVGGTNDEDFPTTPGAFSTEFMVSQEYVAFALSEDAQTLLWSTFVNALGSHLSISDAALDAEGNVYFTSGLATEAYPFTPDALDTELTGLYEGQITVLDATGSNVLYASLLGVGVPGSLPTSATALALDGCNGAYIAGTTYSTEQFVTPGAYDPTYNGGGDAWVMRLITDNPWVDLGSSLYTAAARPRLWPGGPLCAGDPTSLELEDGPAFGSAYLVLGVFDLSAPFKGGLMVPTPDIVIPGVPLDGDGAVVLGFAWPPGLPSGLELYVQAWIPDATGPAGFAASNAVRGTVP